ncbi:MAG: hypothetical protein ACUZ77_00920 [Candidatus Brocadiales bacterium]
MFYLAGRKFALTFAICGYINNKQLQWGEAQKEVIDFVCFIKAKRVAIDPTQAYFWTKKWQDMGKESGRDKETDNFQKSLPIRKS